MDTNYLYLVSVVAVLIVVGVLVYLRYKRWASWKAHKPLMGIIVILSMFYTLTEYPALRWQAWQYNPSRILGIELLGIPVETYLFTFTVFILVSLATIGMADKMDSRSKIK